MNYKIAAAWGVVMLYTSVAMALSPIPTFDKEAVTVHPYQRTGQQEKTLDMQGIDDSKLGNTGTAEHPTFYVQKIIIDSTTTAYFGFVQPPQHFSRRIVCIDGQSDGILPHAGLHGAAGCRSAAGSRKRRAENPCLYSEIRHHYLDKKRVRCQRQRTPAIYPQLGSRRNHQRQAAGTGDEQFE